MSRIAIAVCFYALGVWSVNILIAFSESRHHKIPIGGGFGYAPSTLTIYESDCEVFDNPALQLYGMYEVADRHPVAKR